MQPLEPTLATPNPAAAQIDPVESANQEASRRVELGNSEGVATRIVALARSGQETRQLWQGFAEIIGEFWNCPFATVRLTLPGGTVEAEYVGSQVPAASWRAVVLPEIMAVVSSGQPSNSTFVEQRSGLQAVVHSIPINDDVGIVRGAVAIVTDHVDSQLAEGTLNQLDTLLTLFIQSRHSAPSSAAAAAADGDQPRPQTAGQDGARESQPATPASMVQSAGLANQFESLSELAFSITNMLKTRLGCVEVTLGLVAGKSVKLLAVSGTDNVYPRTPGSIRIRQAMEECLDVRQPVRAQNSALQWNDLAVESLPLHRYWQRHTDNSCCLSLPIRRGDDVVAILSLRRTELLPFESDEIGTLASQLEPLGAAISILNKARRTVVEHVLDALRSTISGHMDRHRTRMLLVAVISLAATLALVLPWPYRLHVAGRIEAAKGRIYAAPIEGRLSQVSVKPGDRVSAGQLLLEMDTKSLDARRVQLQAQAGQRRVQMVEALSAHRATEAAAARSELLRIDEELQSIQDQISDSRVVAERDGVVTDGEGHLRTGETLPLGEPIVRISETQTRHVQLRAPDAIAGRLQAGQTGWIAAASDPSRKLPIRVGRIYQRANIEDGTNYVMAEAMLTAPGDLDVPLGGEVHARIDVGSKPGWWLLLDKPLRALQWQTWQF